MVNAARPARRPAKPRVQRAHLARRQASSPAAYGGSSVSRMWSHADSLVPCPDDLDTEMRSGSAGTGTHPPIAILGQACRLPDAPSPDAFWQLVMEGRTAIRPMNGARWDPERYLHPNPRRRGRSYTDAAALFEGMFDFDAGFFGLSAREAEQMDPQQRILLMTAWEALEDAGLTEDRRHAHSIGVFVGCSASDHAQGFLEDPRQIDAGFMTGNTLSIVANRLSHALDLRGPSFTVDTACSSSMVALHQAVRALSSGEVDYALVGGVHALLSPFPFIGFSRAGMLSPSGQLRPFDARADGYVRGEGAVALVLGRSDLAAGTALRAHSEILATAINTTGRTGGMTKPAAERQAALMQATLARAGIGAEALTFIEAHGTGTPVGDPEEARAIGQALNRDGAAPVPIGTVKGNIGHLEPASGLAGLLKASLALSRRCLPPTVSCDHPSEQIDWQDLGIQLASAPTVLPGAKQRTAMVNSFGFGGANACAIMRSVDAEETQAPQPAKAIVLSAATESALGRQIDAWRDALTARPDLADAHIFTQAHRRSRLTHTAVVRLDAGQSAAAALTDRSAVHRGQHPGGRRELVFAFCGNGANHPGMGQSLWENDPVYRRVHTQVSELFGQIDPALDPRSSSSSTGSSEATRAQPALFALQVAMVEAFAAKGILPGAVVGHSVGEVAAVWASGGLSLEDAVRLIATRAPLLDGRAPKGGMLALLCNTHQAEQLIAEAGRADLALSGDNSPRSVTVSGSEDALEACRRLARKARVAARRLPVEHPFHSPALEPLRDAFLPALEQLRHRAGRIPFASSTEGALCDTARLGPDFWWRNLRAPVRFREAIEALGDGGYSLMLEIGPKPVLGAYIQDTLRDRGRPATVIQGLGARGTKGDTVEIAARCIAAGAEADLTRFVGPEIDAAPTLPAYPWDLERFAISDRRPEEPPDSSDLLGTRVASAPIWQALVDIDLFPWLADHRIDGRTVMPGAGFAFMMLDAARALFGLETEIAGLDLMTPLVFAGRESRELRTSHERESGLLLVESRDDGSDGPWLTHARARVRPAATLPLQSGETFEEDGATTEADQLYGQLESDSLEYGPCFRRVGSVTHVGSTGRASLRAASVQSTKLEAITALDAAFQALRPLIRSALPDVDLAGDLLLPVRIGQIRQTGPQKPTKTIGLRLRSANAGTVAADVRLIAESGQPWLIASGVRLSRVPRKGKPRPELLAEVRVPTTPASTPASLSGGDIGTSKDRATPTDADLLIDAICKQVARAAAAPHTPLLAEATGDPGHPSHGLAVLLAPIIDADGADAEPLDALINALIAIAPEEAPRLRRALAFEAAIGTCLETGTAQPSNWLSTADPGESALSAALTRAVTDVLADWPSNRRLSVVLWGNPQGPVANLVRHHPPVADMRVHTDRGGDIPNPADLVILEPDCGALNSAGSALARHGTLITVDRRQTLLERFAAALASPGHVQTDDWEEYRRSRDLREVHRLRPLGARGDVVIAIKDEGLAAAELPALANDIAAPEIASLFTGLNAGRVDLTRMFGPDAPACVHVPDSGDCPSQSLVEAAALVRDVLRARPERVLIVGTSTSEPPQSAVMSGLSGLLRCVSNEHRESATQLLTLPAPPWCEPLSQSLVEAISTHTPSSERLCHLITSGTTAARVLPLQRKERALAETDIQCLHQGHRGDLGSLSWQAGARRAPAPAEVEIEVAATGLNFRDVMWAGGFLPEEAVEAGYIGRTLGMEISGTVIGAGAEAGIPIGTRVAALCPAGFASHVTVSAEAVVRLPDDMPIEAAAGILVPTLTATYALGEVGRLAAGETVMIHGAAGGVGLAAIEIARAAGARVIATAGSPAKRMLARALGAELVLDSRTLDFAEEVREATDGRGIDVVLNCLSGEAMRRSLECLAPFGRFLELGKRDLLGDTQIGLRALRSNLSYHAIDVDQLLHGRPKIVRRLLGQIERDLTAGRLKPLPTQVYPAQEVSTAMSAMRDAAHIGKIVVRPPRMAPVSSKPAPALGRGAWLITGGLSGFGLATARWLAGQGVGKLWLTSRRGTADADAQSVLAGLRREGVEIRQLAADATDAERMGNVFAQLTAEDRLEGVIHCAMHLEDGPLSQSSSDAIARVLEPKLDGAIVLDALTSSMPECQFVLYSSIAALIGNPGQAAYCAANAAMHAIVERRRTRGLRGVSIGWGPISDVGYLQRDDRLKTRLDEHLGGLMTSDEALAALGEVLSMPEPPPVLYCASMPWEKLAASLPTVSSPLFARVHDGRKCVAGNDGFDLEAVLRMPAADATAQLVELLSEVIADVLRQKPSDLAQHRPLLDLGLDSLMSVDLKLGLEHRLGREVPALAIDAETTMTDLAQQLLCGLRTAPDEPEALHSDPELDALVRAHLGPTPSEGPTRTLEQVLARTTEPAGS